MSNIEHLKLSEALSVSILGNRATARALIDEVQESKKKEVRFDFANIEFTSRAFMDELNALINDNQETKFIKINMNDQVKKMDELVRDTGV